MARHLKTANGFSMIELLFAAGLFTVIAGTVFSLLLTSQWRYQSESSLTSTFQQANIVMDQMVRDIHSAGYPPASAFSSAVTGSPNNSYLFAVAFPWSPSYPSTPCNVVTNCIVPAGDDLILEEQVGGQVQWIRYKLDGTTLRRGMTLKTTADPTTASDLSAANMVAYLENVMNNASPSQIAAIQKEYPNMFQGGNPVPIFGYADATGNSPASPLAIREVNICLIVQSSRVDPQSGQIRVLTLTGQAVTMNVN